ncbi:MAG: hypothetical protein AMXMBFR7_34790 [Planctomycetota bacterium]
MASRARHIFKWLLLVCVLLLFVALTGDIGLFLVPFTLLFGWISFLGSVAGRVSVHTGAVLTFALCMAGFIAGVHLFGRWLYGEVTARKGESRAWPARWTASIAALTVILFAAGIACIGLIHQTIWLAMSSESLVTYERRSKTTDPEYGSFLAYRADEEQWDTARLVQAAAFESVRSNGHIRHVVATDTRGDWTAIVTLRGVNDEQGPAGAILRIVTRGGADIEAPGESLEACLAYFARQPAVNAASSQ